MSNPYSLVARAREILNTHGPGGLLRHGASSVLRNWQAWTFRPYITHRRIAGEQLTLKISDEFGKTWYDTEREWKEFTWIRDHLLQPGGTAVDVGTNHGVTAVLFSKWLGPMGQVIAIDGRAQNVETARENARLNNAANMRCIHTAVGSSSGTVEFVDQPNGGVLSRTGAFRKTVVVPLRTLDEILEGRPVSFLKIDVEGHEIEVLKGAQQTLKSVPNLDIEIHCETFADPAAAVREIVDRIGAAQYRLHWQYAVDGVPVPHSSETTPELVAKYPNIHLFAQRIAV